MANRADQRSSGDRLIPGERPRNIAGGRRRLETLAYWLDDRFRIPGTGIRVGLDGIVGLIPGLGDAATSLISLYIVAEGHRLGLPRKALARMLGNVALDFVLGSIPLLGDIFDIAWKANRRNLRIILDHFDAVDRAGHPRR